MKYGPVDSTLQPTSHLFTDEAEKLQAATFGAHRSMQASRRRLFVNLLGRRRFSARLVTDLLTRCLLFVSHPSCRRLYRL